MHLYAVLFHHLFAVPASDPDISLAELIAVSLRKVGKLKGCKFKACERLVLR